jgi:hypothetical protein
VVALLLFHVLLPAVFPVLLTGQQEREPFLLL